MRTIAILGASAAVGGVMLATGSIAALKAVVPGGGFLYQIPNFINLYRQHKLVVARVPLARGGEGSIRLKHLKKAELLRKEEGWMLRVEHDQGTDTVEGPDALRITGRLLARLNHSGAFKGTVQRAVGRLEAQPSPDAFIASIATIDPTPIRRGTFEWQAGVGRGDSSAALQRLSAVDRLALEMATHEESERRALAGELAALEDEWRDAEEIAGIADNLIVPPDAQKFLERHRKRSL